MTQLPDRQKLPAFSIVSLALPRLTSARLTIFLNLSTVIAILVGYLWLGEAVYAFHLIGAWMILTGVIGTNAFASPQKQDQKNLEKN